MKIVIKSRNYHLIDQLFYILLCIKNMLKVESLNFKKYSSKHYLNRNYIDLLNQDSKLTDELI